MRLRFAGFGGQGVVLCGYIVGKAAMLDGKNAIHTQSYGSASRGGLTRSDVVISDGEIYDLINDELDLLMAMSQQSYDAFHQVLVPDGWLFYESDLVNIPDDHGGRAYGFPATDTAFKTFGRKIIANILMIGFANAIAEVVSGENLVRTIRETVPPGTEDKNIAALEEGMRLGTQAVSDQPSAVSSPARPNSEREGELKAES
jgi:2-oxoglutarate ferredoxin oxidoreductase subunit gamma